MANLKTLKPFKKGSDSRRNIKGRPKSSYSKKVFDQMLETDLEGFMSDMGMSPLQAIVTRMISDAVKGKTSAYKLVMNYRFGRPGKFRIEDHKKIKDREKVLNPMLDKYLEILGRKVPKK